MQLGKTKQKKTTTKAPDKAKTSRMASTEDVARKEAERQERIGVAKQLVGEFEKIRREIIQEEDLFDQEFPEAKVAIGKIDDLKSQALVVIGKAKAAIAEAKLSIGEFTVQLPKSSEGYRGDKLLEVLCSIKEHDDDENPFFEEVGKLLFKLYSRGAISALVVDKKAAKILRSTVPKIGELIEKAWDKGGEDLSPRVSVPKI